MRTLALVLVWLATLLGAYLLGAAREASEGPAAAAPPGARERAPEEARERGPRLAPAPPSTRGGGEGAPAPAPSGEEAPSPAAGAVEPFTLEGVTEPAEANRRLLLEVERLLAKGKAGHLEAIRFLDAMIQTGDLQRLFGGNAEDTARFVYPWLRFLVHHEGQVVDVTETLFETMAKEPQRLADVSENAIEVFAQGVALVLPAVVDAERLERLRSHAEAILRTPEAGQPASVAKNRREIERALSAWAPPLSREEALARLAAADLEPQELQRLLGRLSPEDLAQVDLPRLLGPLLAQGDWRAYQTLARASLAPRDAALLDAYVLEGAAERTVGNWHVTMYLQATGRAGWPAAQALVERAFERGGTAATAFALALQNLAPPPSVEQVRELVDRHALDESLAKALEQAFPAPR